MNTYTPMARFYTQLAKNMMRRIEGDEVEHNAGDEVADN